MYNTHHISKLLKQDVDFHEIPRIHSISSVNNWISLFLTSSRSPKSTKFYTTGANDHVYARTSYVDRSDTVCTTRNERNENEEWGKEEAESSKTSGFATRSRRVVANSLPLPHCLSGNEGGTGVDDENDAAGVGVGRTGAK